MRAVDELLDFPTREKVKWFILMTERHFAVYRRLCITIVCGGWLKGNGGGSKRRIMGEIYTCALGLVARSKVLDANGFVKSPFIGELRKIYFASSQYDRLIQAGQSGVRRLYGTCERDGLAREFRGPHCTPDCDADVLFAVGSCG